MTLYSHLRPSILALAMLTGLTACSTAEKSNTSTIFAEASESPITVYSASSVITMSEQIETADTIAVQDGKILAVGTEADILAKYKQTDNFIHNTDFADQIITPGLIDLMRIFGCLLWWQIPSSLLLLTGVYLGGM